MIWFSLTLLCGLMGGILANRLKLPAGFMIGAMAATAFFNVLSGHGMMPSEIKTAVQTVSGIFIGMKIRKSDLPTLKTILLPAVVSAAFMTLLCMGMGWMVRIFSGVDVITAILGCAPGGIVDMSLIAMDVGADTSVISVLHMIRLVTVLGVFPTLLQLLVKKIRRLEKQPAIAGQPEPFSPVQPDRQLSESLRIFLTALVGCLMGMLGKAAGIPAGPLLFAMMGTTAFNMLTSLASMPMPVKRSAQVLAGTLIGVNVTWEALVQLKSLLFSALVMLVLYFVINLLLAFLLHFVCHYDIMTAFFSCTPGGASDICLMVEDFGGDTARISIMQTTRAIIVVGMYPLLIQLFG